MSGNFQAYAFINMTSLLLILKEKTLGLDTSLAKHSTLTSATSAFDVL